MIEPEFWEGERPALSLLRLVPPVLRARGFRLYTQGGGRLVDLWQYGGAAILGHTPAGILRSLKNAAERGLFVPFPHPLEDRFRKALSRLFPDRVFRVYADTSALRRALIRAGFPGPGEGPFSDPALSPADSPSGKPAPASGTVPSAGIPAGGFADNPPPSRTLPLWRPFLTGQGLPGPKPSNPGLSSPGDPSGSAAFFMPVLPWPAAPRVLVLDPALEQSHPFPPSDLIPPAFLAAALRGIHDLFAAGQERGAMKFRSIKKALAQSKWRRRGIYLSLAGNPAEPFTGEAYAGLFRHFLEQGFLLPPGQDQPLILPGELSPGEEAKLARLLGDFPRPREPAGA